MTRKIFDTDNEEDMALLWSILPEDVDVVKRGSHDDRYAEFYFNKTSDLIASSLTILNLFKINWHDKTEITRPLPEATEADIGNLCYFWDGDSDEDAIKQIGLLTEIDIENSIFKYVLANSVGFAHCRRLTKQEIEELC